MTDYNLVPSSLVVTKKQRLACENLQRLQSRLGAIWAKMPWHNDLSNLFQPQESAQPLGSRFKISGFGAPAARVPLARGIVGLVVPVHILHYSSARTRRRLGLGKDLDWGDRAKRPDVSFSLAGGPRRGREASFSSASASAAGTHTLCVMAGWDRWWIPACMSGLLCHSARSALPFPVALPHRLSGSSGPQRPLTCRPLARRAPAHPRPPLRTDLARCLGRGSRTDEGHGERRRQVPAKLLSLRSRAGCAGPGMQPLSAGGLCVRVPRPHYPPLGPRQVSAASPGAPTTHPRLCCKLPSADGKRGTFPAVTLHSPRPSLQSSFPPSSESTGTLGALCKKPVRYRWKEHRFRVTDVHSCPSG